MRALVDSWPNWVINVPDGWEPFAPIEIRGALWIRTGRAHRASVTISAEPAGTTFDVDAFVSSVLHGTVLYSTTGSPGAWYCLVSSNSPNGIVIVEQQAWEVEGSLMVITATCLAIEYPVLRCELTEMLAEPEPVGPLAEVLQ
jgi:hypothetical protein